MPADAKFDCSFTVAVMGQMRRWLKSQEENGTIEFFGGWLDHDGHSVSFFGLNEVSGTTRAITKGREGNGEMIGEGGRGKRGDVGTHRHAFQDVAPPINWATLSHSTLEMLFLSWIRASKNFLSVSSFQLVGDIVTVAVVYEV
jgi:hypothetical protein